MKNQIISLALIAGLAACSGGNPFDDPDENPDDGVTTPVEEGEEGTGIERDGIPPGTTNATPDSGLFRSEAKGGADSGDGFAQGVSYDSTRDEFTVDNLAFDGDAPYTRVAADINGDGTIDPIRDLNDRFAVYEAPVLANDPVTGDAIDQFTYRAVYGVSRNRTRDADGNATTTPTTEFAIVRTGSYENYGFGGFIYQRNNGVTLPNNLQARYRGRAGGLRDFDGSSTLQYTTANVVIDVDFDDFNDSENVRGDGVKGNITGRKVYNLNGQEVASDGTTNGPLGLPNVGFVISPDVLDSNGEIVTDIFSLDGEGARVEEGKFYAVMSGENPDEIVGVYVLEGSPGDSDAAGALGTGRDTSGFIIYRGPTDTP